MIIPALGSTKESRAVIVLRGMLNRMLPSIVILLDVITFVKAIDDKPLDVAKTKTLLGKIENITPDTGDFEDASYALNACAATYETLEYLIDKDSSHIVNIGTCLTDTIDFKIQEEMELNEMEIDSHPLMIEAREFLLDGTT